MGFLQTSFLSGAYENCSTTEDMVPLKQRKTVLQLSFLFWF